MSKQEMNDLEPKEGATLDEWKEWSKRLKSRINNFTEYDKKSKEKNTRDGEYKGRCLVKK